MAIEEERKYLIRDEDTFSGLLGLLRPKSTGQSFAKVGEFEVRDSISKSRDYRYFDTFERTLERQEGAVGVGGILEHEGGSASIRDRGTDYILAVKIPTGEEDQRQEMEQEISADKGRFYDLDPLQYLSEEQRTYIEQLCGNRPLAEVVRLKVMTHRFDLYLGQEHHLQVSVDDVVAEASIGMQRSFREFEIEIIGVGTPSAKDRLALYFLDRYGPGLIRSSLPKWIKALRLIRGEEIIPDAPI